MQSNPDPPDPAAILRSICGVDVSESDFQRARDLWWETMGDTAPAFDSLPRSQQVFGALLSRIVED